jgi:hypothetical protein
VDCGYLVVDAFCPRCDPDPVVASSTSPEVRAAGIGALPVLSAVPGGDQRRASRPYLAAAAVFGLASLGGLVLAISRLAQADPPLTAARAASINASTSVSSVLVTGVGIGSVLLFSVVARWMKPLTEHMKAVRGRENRYAAFAAAAGGQRGWRSAGVSQLLLGLYVVVTLVSYAATVGRILWRPALGTDSVGALLWDSAWFLIQCGVALTALVAIPVITRYRQWRVGLHEAGASEVWSGGPEA